MRVIPKEEALNNPGYCMMTHDIDGPFLDCDTWINDINPYAYIHVPYVELMGRAVGMVPKAEVDELKAQMEEMDRELSRLKIYADTIKAAESINEEIKVGA